MDLEERRRRARERARDFVRDVRSPNEVRRYIHTLFTEGNSRKMGLHGTDEAIETFSEALSLAELCALPQPWLALAHYRMGHLLSRKARTEAELREVDAHWVAAAHAPVIGPWPLLYRLPILQRLGVPSSEVEAAFERARRATVAWTARDAELDALRDVRQGARLQSSAFGVLDIAAMFCGLDRTPLDGHGAVSHAELLMGGHWVVLTGERSAASLRMPESYARAEIASRRERDPSVCAVVLDETGEHASWFGPGMAEGEKLAASYASLLLYLLAGNRSRAEINRQVFGGEDAQGPEQAFRAACSRLSRRFTAAGVSVPPGQGFIEEVEGKLRLASGIPLVGACKASQVLRAAR
jgi:hypothetical protein